MGLYAVLDAWAAALDAAGVPCTTDSRGQFTSPSGWALLSPIGAEALPSIAGGCRVWLLSGSIYICAEGPWGTAQARALDQFAPRLLGVLGDHLGRMWFPDSLTLAALGVDVPAVALDYANVPVRFDEG